MGRRRLLGFTFLDRWAGRTKRFILIGASINGVLFTLLALVPAPGLVLATAAFALLGLVGGFNILIASHGRRFYPDRLIGRGITTVNFAVLFGAASLQALTGVIVSRLATSGAPIPLDATLTVPITLV